KPFSDVLIHGIVRDDKGRKMSKSLGNGIDPLEIIDLYGADSLRFTLISGNSPGNDMRFQMERVESARNFMNKIWNASRFTLMNLEGYKPGAFEPELSLADKWILTRASKVAEDVSANLEKYELGEALRAAHDFAWDEFCDWYVEIAKQSLYKGDEKQKYTAQFVLAAVLRTVLELLHPFVPFITEELWQQLPHVGDTIMLAKYPDGSGLPRFEAEEARMNTVMEVIRSIRNIRAEMKVPMGKKAPVIFTGSEEDLASLKEAESYILPLAQASDLTWLPADTPAPDKAAKAHVRGVDIYLPLEGLIDVDKEVARIEKEIAAVEGEMKRLAGKLGNPNFLAKAPADVVAKEQEKKGEFEAKLASLKAHLELFK
ncbi:MAG: class I tRNA ligase family protein, partial [Firmicutes bacterium]|nr:class I tRNA ligase family protein [Bacillota bacterium]